MSRPDLLNDLRGARPTAPPELREHVRAIAASEARPPRRRVTWRLGVVVAFAAGLAIAAAVVATRGGGNETAQPTADQALNAEAAPPSLGATAPQAKARDSVHGSAIPAPSTTRAQRYRASLELRVANADEVASASRQAQAIARSLGGYVASANVNARGKAGSATLRLRVPRANVQDAVAQLSQLGTIVAEDVSVEDLQTQVNAGDRLVDRLQARLRSLRAQEQTPAVKEQIATVTKRIQQLQRTRAATLREAHYATVDLQLTTRKAAAAPPKPHGTGPLHGLGVAFTWLGIGAVYALALGAPFVLLGVLLWLAARTMRRRREATLLAQH
jgi:hypothetical protein